MRLCKVVLALSLVLLHLSSASSHAAQRITWEPDPDYNEERDRRPRVPDDYDEEEEEETPPGDDYREEEEETQPSMPMPGTFHLPAFQGNWGLSRQVYERTLSAMRQFSGSLRNRRYVAVIDFSKPSNRHRFFLFDLSSGTMQRLHVAHGKGSDPRASGYARSFSNRPQSMQSSLGAYKTLGTFYGKHGLALQLSGLESSNSNAFRRAIVMHGARYVSEAQGRAGRSWGCPALDQRLSSGVINKIKGGALLLISR